VVTKAKAIEGRWRTLDLSKTWWDLVLHDYANARGVGADADDGLVLVAPRRNRRFSDLLDGLTMLRDAGIAEPR
jgi:hypothetical protein